jgi:hypothetical protein
MNYYQLLGININATHEEITRAYREEIFKNHPDRNPGKENEKLHISILLNEAYEVLSNKEAKIEYDKNIINTEIKLDLQKKKEKYLNYLKSRINEHSLKFENNYYSDLHFKNGYEIMFSNEIEQIIGKLAKIDKNNRFIDLNFETTDDYKFRLYMPTGVYKRKYCLALNFFKSKLLYVLVINKTEYDILFKKRRTNLAVLYFNGENIKYSDNILDIYIKCIIHYN